VTEDPAAPELDTPTVERTPETVASTTPGLALSVPVAAGQSVKPNSLTLSAGRRYTFRFAITYAFLAAVLIAAVVGSIVLVAKPGHRGSSNWSAWKPTSGSTVNEVSQIANHVGPTYKLSKSKGQLVAVVGGAPQITSGTHAVTISHIAVRKKANNNTGIQISPSAGLYKYQLCGLGANCSIQGGKPSETRGMLVRREALELALYTFKYVPAITSVIAFMPPPPGQSATTLLYLQKSNYSKELSQPLRKTLPLLTPPLPTKTDPTEAATIDKLTLPAVYSYTLQALQDNSALLVLDPVAS
jgi:hypothetical protein